MNARTALGMTATMIALSGMAACGTHHAGGVGSPSHPKSPATSSSSPSSGNHSPLVIKLNGATGTYRMAVGQKLIVQIADGTKIQPGKTKSCTSENDAVLKQLCTSGASYEYQAVRSGTAQLNYTIRPNCKPGTACPAWIRKADFQVSVS